MTKLVEHVKVVTFAAVMLFVVVGAAFGVGYLVGKLLL